MVRNLFRLFVLIFFLLNLGGCRVFFKTYYPHGSYSDHLQKAEESTRQDEYEEAIEHYKQHIEFRLAQGKKPSWENPYFYYLIIGDLYLKMKAPLKAIESYTFAEKQEVEPGLISDRLRLVASWYAQEGEYEKAIEVLSEYNDRDPILFDLTRDRLAREHVEELERSLEDEDTEQNKNEP